MNLKVLALDLGTKTGWAHSCGQSGVWNLAIGRDESSGFRLIKLRNNLDKIKSSLGVDLLVFEAARFLRYGHATKLLAQFQAVIELWCIDNNIEYKGYSATSIKKFATGNGHCNKDEILTLAKKKWKRIKDHNHADALWLLEYVLSSFEDNDGQRKSRSCSNQRDCNT